MTVEIQDDKKIFTGDGIVTAFSFSPIVIFATTDIEVWTEVIATGVLTLLVEGTGTTNYSVAAATSFPGTGTVTYPATLGTELPATEKLIIKRVLTLEQQTDLKNQGGYFSEVQETQFDKLAMIAIQMQEVLLALK